MSDTTTPLSTADQPSHSLANILAHPGSSYAGAGIAMLTIGKFMTDTSYPTTATGWIAYALALGTALMAALGK